MMEDIITDSNINSLDSALDNAINNTNDWVQETEGDHPEGEADGDVDVDGDGDGDGNAEREGEVKTEGDDGTQFKDIDWSAQAEQDDEDINRMFAGDRLTMPEGLDSFGDKEIDQAGKDADAIDFEDMSDDDLPSDDGSTAAAAPEISQVPGLTEDEGTSHENDELNDLFGGDDHDEPGPLPSSPTADANANADVNQDKPRDPSPPVEVEAPEAERPPEERNITDEEFNNMSLSERMRLNFPQIEAGDNAIGDWVMQTNTEDPSTLPLPQTEAELLQHKFPTFEKHKTLFHNQLFPQWPAEYMYKEPPTKDRDPAEFVPTKLELELDADSSKLFRIPDSALGAAQQRSHQYSDDWSGSIGGVFAAEIDDGLSDDSDNENEMVGGFSLDEIATVCEDWDSLLSLPKAVEEPAPEDEEMDEWDREFLLSRPQKKRPKYEPGLPDISSYNTQGFEDFVSSTRRFGKRVRLDLGDPYLLLDETQSERPTKRPKLEEKMKRMANGQLRRDIRHHFNISNDEAYDQLKANHKNKVRAVLSNRAVEHSLPALKLTFPFYRTRLSSHFWEHHRRKFDVDKLVRHAVGVRKPSRVKKKDWKNKRVAEIFKTSKDLSLNDNSTVVLFEYSEQYPIMMSNFGMGSRVINYYRRKDQYEDEKLDKAEIGESHVLLPEDRSPFSIFGTVDPGETVPTLHNEMYRAPIFKHASRPTDFLLGYTTNIHEGPKFYLRNIDHVYAVGQTFPSMEVPGPHARKVTNTAKNRLKMISYRMMRKKPTQDVSLAEITPHVFDHHDPQNRQKMKEFLSYDRERKTWVLPEGQNLMEEKDIRNMIKPEDVCLIEAMQVGQQLLMHAGYDPKNAKDAGDEEDEAVEEPLVARMSPWEITKNFIDASAGKAMVALHGEGDPTGHGLGFSFIKTSMKGGYINAVQGPLATSADAIERERKANGGHSYNVKKQQDMYNTAIRQIWERQKTSLSDDTTHDDGDVLDTANEDDRFNPRQSFAASAAHLDDGRSQLSRLSGASRLGRRKLKIMRKKRNDAGDIVTESVVLEDPVVIRSYMRQRKELEEKNRDVYSLQPTADADDNREKQKLVDRELMRLLKNQDRRQVREKQGKGKRKNAHFNNANSEASPDPSSADKAAAGTTRKCANCGQVGHIKTNKSKCPLLNGTISTNNNGADHGGFGSFSTPTAAQPGGD